jgi:site-specific DNA-methyltransferase (adenine-specific)
LAELNLCQGELPGCLAETPDDTYHAILCDPPYGLGEIKDPAALLRSWLDGEDGEQGVGMLSRAWDVVVPPSAWREYLRVTRPGGLIFAYSHARCYHWQALAMQLAGWRLLPMIVRIHGSAMALGHAVGKAIDKAAGAEREVVGRDPGFSAGRKPRLSMSQRAADSSGRLPLAGVRDVTAPATPLAALFDGHNTALKNNLEPIVVAVKPPDGTWAENAARWGCGAFNVQMARVPAAGDYAEKFNSVEGLDSPKGGTTRGAWNGPRRANPSPAGRYPSNVQLFHEPGCGADWCVPGCGVRELGEMGRERGVHSAGGGVERGRLAASQGSANHARGERRVLSPFRVEDGGEDSRSRFFYRARAPANERHAGCEHLLWRRAPDHPDGWEIVDRETWKRLGDEAAEKAKGTDGYRERMAEGYMRREEIPAAERGVYGSNRVANRHREMKTRQVLDVDRLDAAAYLDAARARVRTAGNPHLAVKSLDGNAYLAKLLLQPVVNGVKPRLLVPYAGTGSETIGAMLGGWEIMDAFEASPQWNEVHKARFDFWRDIVEQGGTGKALELLRRWGTAPGGDDPEAKASQLSLFAEAV